MYAQTCQTADIRAYPTVKFYRYQGTKVKCLLCEQVLLVDVFYFTLRLKKLFL